jgi:hypothetical protein
VLLVLLACTERPSVSLPVPHVPAAGGFEAEALVAAGFGALGFDVRPEDVFDAAGIDPVLGRGAKPGELRGALVALGFDPGEAGGPPTFDQVYADLRAGVPSIVYVSDADEPRPVLVVGYAPFGDQVLLEDPILGPTDIGRELLFDEVTRVGEAPLRLAPTPALAPPPRSTAVSAAALARAVRRARVDVPPGLTVEVVPPFVLVSDEPPAQVEARAELLARTIRLFQQDYFQTELAEPWEIWGMRDLASYRRVTERLFGRSPETPYGFANGERPALVMNLALGGGTLVHELAHPYLNADIPNLPYWFNEGFASLFEQVGEENGHLVGYVNWRLPTLQYHITQGDLPQLPVFMAQDWWEFQGERVALNYAMARYLCFWLQERGLLQTFYRELRAREGDPTGYETFRRVVGDDEGFEAEWQVWAAGLDRG